jgi:protein TonB
MPRDERMFRDVVDPSPYIGSHQRASVVVTVALEVACVGALIVAPLLASDVLPSPRAAVEAFIPAAPLPPAPPPPARQQAAEPPTLERVREAPNLAPLEAPPVIQPEPFPPDVAFERVPGTGVAVPVVGRGGDGISIGAAPPPSPPAPPRGPERVGGRVSAPQKIRHVAPVYPFIARQAHVEGDVRIEATIDETGRVSDARVLQGHPLLNEEALAAVRQWQFTPTRLNGEPTAVIMNVTVTFRLR